MKIEILYMPECPHYLAALELVQEVLAATGISAEVELIRVETEADAHRLEFMGSPTVRVDGVDVEPHVTFASPARQPAGGRDFGLRCRSYAADGQARGWPGERMLRDTIEVAHLVEMGILVGCC